MDVSSILLSRYINSLLVVAPYRPNARDVDFIKSKGLQEYICSKIASSEFRRSRIDYEMLQDITSKIQTHLKDSSPISFSVPFGAYKHWSAWSYPEPEWAEVFNMNYMLRYTAPIAQAYEPGVTLHYSFGDSVMDTVSNIPAGHTQLYIDKVKQLVALFQSRVQPNVRIDMVRINNFYTPDQHAGELRSHFEDNVKNWERKYSMQDREAKLASARRNLMAKGIEDLTGLSSEEWEKRVLRSAMWCDAHDSLSQRRGFNKYSGHIQLGNIRGRRLELHVGSCDTSVHQFWVGIGILEAHKSSFLQRIISQNTLDAMRADIIGGLARHKVDNDFVEVSSNYDSIYLLDRCGLASQPKV